MRESHYIDTKGEMKVHHKSRRLFLSLFLSLYPSLRSRRDSARDMASLFFLSFCVLYEATQVPLFPIRPFDP